MARSIRARRALSGSDRVVLAAALGACALGGVLRWLAAQTDPWLDEVWTFELLPRILASSDVVFRLHHANNHPLNTLFLYWLGDGGEAFWWYRLHTMIAGVASIALAVAIAARRGVAEAAFAGVLFATSFLLVHHSSQARGYSLMLLGALAACYALQRHHDRPTLANTAAYGVAIAWALLANLYALYLLIGLSLWSAAVAIERAGGLRGAVVPLLRLHAIPALALGFVIVVFYLPGLTGTQFTTNHYGIVVQAASLLLGGPFVGRTAEALLWVAAFVFGLGLYVLHRDRDREWLMYALVVVAAPALVIAVSRPRALFVRFFAVSEVFLLLLVAIVLGWLWRTGRMGQLAAVCAAAGIVWGNAQHIDHLLVAGRGQYLAASRYMALESVGDEFSVGSDHAFGTGMMLRFYDRFIPEVRIVFVAQEHPAHAPEWFVRVGHPRPRELQYANQLYERDRAFMSGGFGFDWQLYRRVPQADAVRRRSERRKAH